jgi:hypothetical protein
VGDGGARDARDRRLGVEVEAHPSSNVSGGLAARASYEGARCRSSRISTR